MGPQLAYLTLRYFGCIPTARHIHQRKSRRGFHMGDETVFKIDERVNVTNVSPEIAGVVRAIWIDHMGAQFQVQYVDSNGRIQRDWFASTELRAVQPVTE